MNALNNNNGGCCDIVETIPWKCDDEDCEQQWHLENFWIQYDGYTSDRFSDGDHEEIEYADIPHHTKVFAAWREYYRFVLNTGTDPIGQFSVRSTIRCRERWEVKLTKCIAGYLVSSIRHGDTLYRLCELPKHVRQFLTIRSDDSRGLMRDFPVNEPLPEGMKCHRWEVIHITYDKPRKPSAYVRELRAAAKKSLEIKK